MRDFFFDMTLDMMKHAKEAGLEPEITCREYGVCKVIWPQPGDSWAAQSFIKHEGAVKIVGELVTDESYVIAVGPTSTELLSALNAALLALRDDGTLIRLRDEWF